MISIGPHDLQEKSIPDADEDWASRYREKLQTETYVEDGVIRWSESDNIVPPSIFRRDAYVEVPQVQVKAREAELDEILGDRENTQRTAEQKFEQRAAFGEGKTVTNVLTGETYTT